MSALPTERLATRQRPRELGPVEPLLALYAETPARFCREDGQPASDFYDEILRTFAPTRAWACRIRRWQEHDAAELEADLAYEEGAVLRCLRFARGQDHRFPPLPRLEEGSPFTLLLDPDGDQHCPLEHLDVRFRFRYDELARAARRATSAPERARWVHDMLEVLHVLRHDAPARILRAFAGHAEEFSERGHDPFYVVSDLYALVRLGRDPWPFLEPTVEHFADDTVLIRLAYESRSFPAE